MRKSTVVKGIAGVGGALAAVAGFSSFGMATYITKINGQTLEEARKWQDNHYDTSFYDSLKKKDYTINSYDDYLLNVQFVKNPKDTDKYVILTHGYTDNRIGTLKYMKIYLDRGYNCIIWDLRGHGLNRKTYTTYSIRESKDLLMLIKDTKKRYGENIHLGLHGESLGSATSVAVLQYKPQVEFAVLDCGFADIENVLRLAMKNAKMPGAVFEAASAANQVIHGNSFYEMRPIDALNTNTVPLCFIHGAADDFIIPDNSKRMAAATKGYSEVHLIDGAGHAGSVLADPEKYREYVNGFLDKVESGELKNSKEEKIED